MKLVRLIKMCLNETYSTVRVGKDLSDMFSIKEVLKGDDLSQFLFIFAFEYAIRRVQEKLEGSKLCGTNHLLVYAVYVGRQCTHYKEKHMGFTSRY
jgi:hypothetical protein